jgi:two-component system, NarL family, sensor histidine kinase DevS
MATEHGRRGPVEVDSQERGAGLLQAFLALSPDAAVVVDTTGTIRATNDMALSLFGYGADEMDGRPIELLLPERMRGVHERQRSAYLAAPHARPMGVGLELRGRRKDGSEFPVDISLAPLSADDGPGYVVAAVRDITALRRGEQLAARLAAIVQSSDVAIISITPDRIVDSWNPAAERLLGYRSDEVVGGPVDVLVPDEVRADLAAEYERVFAGAHVDLFDTTFRRKTGNKVEVAATLSAMRDAHGELVGYSVMLRDLTERRREQALLAAAQADREVLAERERIARDLHDFVIQRIFTAGIGLEGVATAVTQPELSRRLQMITGELDAAVREIRSSIFTLQRRPGASGSVRGELLDVAAQAAEGLGFAPSVSFDGPVDSLVTDRVAEQLLAVLREGLSNVARHAHATAVEVAVRADPAGVSLSISDNGRGMVGVTRRSGLQNLLHRATLLGGDLVVATQPQGGTRLDWSVPLGDDAPST